MRMPTPVAVAITTGALLTPTSAVWAGPTPESTEAEAPAVVTGIEVREHRRYDRLIVRYRGGVPEVDVSYRRRLHMEGSGRRVKLKGRTNVLVDLQPARAHRNSGAPTIDNTGDVVKFEQVREWRLLGDFEGIVSLGLGVRRWQAVSVKMKAEPKLVIIDFFH